MTNEKTFRQFPVPRVAEKSICDKVKGETVGALVLVTYVRIDKFEMAAPFQPRDSLEVNTSVLKFWYMKAGSLDISLMRFN
jgi:hypothetical protein